jgi:hypothetical protein
VSPTERPISVSPLNAISVDGLRAPKCFTASGKAVIQNVPNSFPSVITVGFGSHQEFAFEFGGPHRSAEEVALSLFATMPKPG